MILEIILGFICIVFAFVIFNLTKKVEQLEDDREFYESYINNFVDNEFLSVDSLAFRTHIEKCIPDVDMTYKFTSILGDEKELVVPMTTQFFWPSAK